MKDILEVLSESPELTVFLFFLLVIAGFGVGAGVDRLASHRERIEAFENGYSQVYDKDAREFRWVKPPISAEQ